MGAGDTNDDALPVAVRLDALLRLQLEEQNQSRHHDNMRDRALGNLFLVIAALLAIMGAMYQAKLEDNPTIFLAGKFLLPLVMTGFGVIGCALSLRHSLHASRHWRLARVYREEALRLIDGGQPGSRHVARKRGWVSRAFARSSWAARRMERWDYTTGGVGTWIMWLALPALMTLAGITLFVAAVVSDWRDTEQPPRPTDVRVIVDPDPAQPLRRRPFDPPRTTAPSAASEPGAPAPQGATP
ncbi:MAG: hypothetical protein K2X11_14185 [Acetobacteraceae bacterium]|nr:hypothetical protein [Acetobacteraceae bacterium]